MSGNHLTLVATLTEVGQRRFTPAGVPVLECRLQHVSSQIEAGIARQIELEIEAVGIGEITDRIAALVPGTVATFQGFLARKRKTGKTLVYHLTHIE